MNDNSSRFAKFLELSFRGDGQVIGGMIITKKKIKNMIYERSALISKVVQSFFIESYICIYKFMELFHV